MKEQNLTIRAVARICETSPSVVSQWLTGSSPSDPIGVLRLAQTAGWDFQRLLTGTTSQTLSGQKALGELFDQEDAAEFSGIFLIEAKRLRWKKNP